MGRNRPFKLKFIKLVRISTAPEAQGSVAPRFSVGNRTTNNRFAP